VSKSGKNEQYSQLQDCGGVSAEGAGTTPTCGRGATMEDSEKWLKPAVIPVER